MSNSNSTYLASKPRYEILDGLRGVAAMIVVIYHLFEDFGAGVPVQGANHGYLAVDFFFVLSGFVIGYAYDDRWDRMSYADFFKRRLIRLHPMVIFGAFLGMLIFYFTGGGPFGLVDGTSWWNLILVFLVACTMIPLGSGMDIRGWGETYPLNGPAWSLMLEYIANILYAFVIRHLGKVALGVLVFIFGLLTINHGLCIDVYNAIPDTWYAKYTFIGGWGIVGVQLHIAITRLLYPFFCGLLISRIGKFIKVKGGFWWASLLIAVMLLMPRVGGNVPENFWMNGLYETLCILIGFPVVVMIGAGSKVIGQKSVAVCDFLGKISFPLYITHYIFIYMHISWIAGHPDAPLGTCIMISACVFIMSVMLAYAALKLYDEPVREWLKNKLFSKKSK